MKGDMAFFYHSNCKVPGIVGTMEIVEEHSVDSKLTYPGSLISTIAFDAIFFEILASISRPIVRVSCFCALTVSSPC